jgi:fluoroquinolone transport system permease protein
MRNGLILFKSEIKRLLKYRILTISFAVSVLWMVLLYFIGEESARSFVGLFIAIDATIMSMMMIGASLFYERQENTLKPLLVTPVSITTMVIVKVMTTIYIALQSAILISLFVYFVMGIEVQFIPLILLVSLVATAHAMIGFMLSLKAKEFTGYLVNVVMYAIIFAYPSLFLALNVVPESLAFLLVISPSHSAFIYLDMVFLIEGAYTYTSFVFLFSVIYLIIVSAVLYLRWVKPRYPELAVRE